MTPYKRLFTESDRTVKLSFTNNNDRITFEIEDGDQEYTGYVKLDALDTGRTIEDRLEYDNEAPEYINEVEDFYNFNVAGEIKKLGDGETRVYSMKV